MGLQDFTSKMPIKNQFILTPLFLNEALPGLERLAKPDWMIIRPSVPNGAKPIQLAAINKRIAHVVAETISAGKRPVSIAGDCVSAIGVLAGLQHAGIDPFLIWFDAHGDFNTPETSPSGFLGGMPLAMIVGRGDLTITRAVGLKPLPETNVLLTDARDLDPKERMSLKDSAVIHLKNPKSLVSFPLPDMFLYIHIDTDVLSPAEAPAMNYPVPGGLSAADLKNIFRQLAEKRPIGAVSVSSWNPNLDRSQISERVCMDLLESLVG
jgi:arginase